MKRVTLFSIAFAAVAMIVLAARAADTKTSAKPGAHEGGAGKVPAYLTPETAGPDFVTQGEYLGEVGKEKLGAQVIALGNGTFLGVFLPGGLPGDGYDGKSRSESPGKGSAAGEATFAPADGKGYTATISGGTMKGKTDKGEAFELKKIERTSPTEGAKPPAGATVLFDGTNTDAWAGGKMDDRKLLYCGTKTKKTYQSFTLHVEYLLPFKPLGRDQDRGNSGIYIQDRYEMQVLDTFGHPPEFNGAGAVYRQHAPSVNMCFPPLRWQTYDIDFTAPKWEGEKKVKNARVTLKLNGVTVQDDYEITTKTGAGKPEGPEAGPIQLQQHNNPVFYRNIWIVEK